ncbi:hypothetical protein K450DRAFT_217644 [Umbelopsis ramanniana AG]|uniref:mRNA m(6)A methyltransferase n=1 Tax=Umbelopsis ramanniana AG TaxID=1314678 RepID=A0AAD5EJ24_UMBRA|nr:uncharacterized protein K450DRAFT_217644 [Umbelopsis ramanniana AG]KAI8584713.1 hypothetical protein K450DRAFT_217644 [Umbelopsis ramanniana AG]
MADPSYRWFDEVPPRKKFKQQHSGIPNHNYPHESRQRVCPVALDELLQTETTSEEIQRLTWKSSLDGFKSHCEHGTKQECRRRSIENRTCDRLHFKHILNSHTDSQLGDCSYLNTCHRMGSCKYMHYCLDATAEELKPILRPTLSNPLMLQRKKLLPPQWIKCDIRKLDFDVIGKFTVILADPPWDIHMSLPYGTMTDDEMKDLKISKLQDRGLLFLWVTSRAMELGRECLMNWGYELVQELVWVKTNQLQRIIRTGRTGHWLNHSKEHCLIGRKGNDPFFNVGLDCDVLVSEVRETSRKPDELYDIINRLSPGTRKLEMFGREHNLQPGWLTLGNQLKDSRIYEPQLVERYNAKYANHPIRLFSLPHEYR